MIPINSTQLPRFPLLSGPGVTMSALYSPVGGRHYTAMSFPLYSRAELHADAAIHIAGVIFGVIGGAALITVASLKGYATPIVSSAIYVAGLLAMLTFSALYNMIRPDHHLSWLRRFDHAAIFLMIAGSCTPFALQGLTSWGVAMTVLLWTLAFAGAAMKLCFPRRYDRVAIALYLALGWGGALVLADQMAALPMASVILLATGGVLYSVGVIFHVWETLKFQNAVWHAFVLAAAICHYAAITTGVVLASP
jgi:hemolysin III